MGDRIESVRRAASGLKFNIDWINEYIDAAAQAWGMQATG